MNENLSQYKESYITEAEENLKAMSLSLVQLEKTPDDPVPLGEIFRAAHTLKSMAATMEYAQTAGLCHAVEDLLTKVKNGTIDLGNLGEHVDLLFESLDLLEANLKAITEEKEELEATEMVEKLKKIVGAPLAAPDVEAPLQPKADSSLENATPIIEKIQRINVKVERLDTLMNLSEELLVAKMRLDRIREGLEHPELTTAVETLGRLISEVQYNVMQVRMVPIGFVFNRFPRMVRDLAKQEGKGVELVLAGSDIELDRGIVDEIGESLVHLLRNAVDHGIETPEERRQAGKSPQGTITVTASRTKEFVVITVADDGAGLKASVDEIFKPGFSTTKEVTDISGRGIGLPVVQKKIEAIGGQVRLESSPNQGTSFKLEIPLTLVVIKTLFIEVSGKLYAIPMASIDRLVTIAEEDLKGMFDYEAIVLEGEEVPVTRLDILFGSPPSPPLKRQSVVVVRRGEERLGLVVDSLISTQEVVIKPLSRIIRENRYFAGSALIGSGEVVLILDVAHLVLSKRRRPEGRLPAPENLVASSQQGMDGTI